VDLARKLARCVAIARENDCSVAEFMLVGHARGR